MAILFKPDKAHVFRLCHFSFMDFGSNIDAEPLTQSLADQQATHYELFSAREGYKLLMPGMRTARGSNPSLKMLDYDLPGSIDNAEPQSVGGGSRQHADDLFIYETETPPTDKTTRFQNGRNGYPALRVWTPRWIKFCADFYPPDLDASGYDGIEIDVMGKSFAEAAKDGRDQGTHVSGNTYAPNDVVLLSSTYYRAKVTTSTTPPGADWTTLSGYPLPYNPFTRAGGFSGDQWLKWTTNLAHAIAAALPVDTDGHQKPTFVNAVADGPAYYDTANGATKQILAVCTGSHVEQFLATQGSSYSYPTETEWQQNVDMLVEAGLDGKVLLVQTKYWPSSASISGLTDAQRLDRSKIWHKLSLSTFLLGNNGLHYWNFRDDNMNVADSTTDAIKGRHRQTADLYYSRKRPLGTTGDIWWNRVNLGVPNADATMPISATRTVSGSGAYYRRDFATGVVLCNPTANSTNAITLPAGTWQDIDGTNYTSSITLAARQGAILSKVS